MLPGKTCGWKLKPSECHNQKFSCITVRYNAMSSVLQFNCQWLLMLKLVSACFFIYIASKVQENM